MEQTIGAWLVEHGVPLVWAGLLAVFGSQLFAALTALVREQIARIANERWQKLALDIVQAVEQALSGETGAVKKQAALKKLVSEGVPQETADNLVESAVFALNNP